MSITVYDNGTQLIIQNWIHPVTFYKNNFNALLSGNDSLPIMDVSTKFRITKGRFFSHTNAGGAITRPSAFVSYLASVKTDDYGNYLELLLTFKVKTTDTDVEDTCVLKFCFYDGKELIPVLVVQRPTILMPDWNNVYVRLNFELQMQKWFSIDKSPTYFHTNVSQEDWLTTFGTYTPQHYCDPYFSSETAGITRYTDANEEDTADARLSGCNTYSSATAYGSFIEAGFFKGFVLTTNVGYPAIYEYHEWLYRNYPKYSLPPWGYRSVQVIFTNLDFGTKYVGEYKQTIINDLPVAIADKMPSNVYDNDFGWFTYEGDWDFRDDLGTWLINYEKNLGYIPQAWTSPIIDVLSSTAQRSDIHDLIWLDVNGVPVPYYQNDTFGHGYWVDASKPKGRQYLEDMAQKIYNNGFRAVRYDFSGGPYPILATKILYEKYKSIDPYFMFEQTYPIRMPYCDILRTNDQNSYDTDFFTRVKKQYKAYLVHTPNKILDTDMIGTLGYLFQGEAFNPSVATVIQHLNMQQGYGRGYPTWTGATFWRNALPEIKAILDKCDKLPREIPKKSIKNNWEGYDTLLTYSDGSTVEWFDATGELRVNAVNPVNEPLYNGGNWNPPVIVSEPALTLVGAIATVTTTVMWLTQGRVPIFQYSTDKQTWLDMPTATLVSGNLWQSQKDFSGSYDIYYYFRAGVLNSDGSYTWSIITSQVTIMGNEIPIFNMVSNIKVSSSNQFWLTANISNTHNIDTVNFQYSQNQLTWVSHFGYSAKELLHKTNLDVQYINNNFTYRSLFDTQGKTGTYYYRVKLTRFDKAYYSSVQSFNLDNTLPQNIVGYNPYLPKSPVNYNNSKFSVGKMGSNRLGFVKKTPSSNSKLGAFLFGDKVLGSFVTIDIRLNTTAKITRYYSVQVPVDQAFNLYQYYSTNVGVNLPFNLLKAQEVVRLISNVQTDIKLEASMISSISIKPIVAQNISAETNINNNISIGSNVMYQIDIEANM